MAVARQKSTFPLKYKLKSVSEITKGVSMQMKNDCKQ